MCGIVGYIGPRDALDVIISGLERLEYRGYDSAGVAVYENGELRVTRAVGKLAELKKVLAEQPRNTKSPMGIGHTRWATHGKPSEENAHPHTAGRVSLIHNGIIENYIELREELQKEGRKFSSETDTEILAHLLDRNLSKAPTPFEALKKTCREIQGSYAFVAIDSKNSDRLLVAKNSTPIVIGIGKDDVFVASDIPAILNYTREVVFLEDGDVAEIKIGSLSIEQNGKPVERKVHTITWDPVTAQKGGYKHYMLKEIHEQVEAISETLRGRLRLDKGEVGAPELKITAAELKNIDRIVLVACGTAWHACLVAKFYLEQFTGIPCDVDYGSEFRYRTPVFNERTLAIAVSQSGETLDTLAAVDLLRTKARMVAVCNVLGSSLSRKIDDVLFTHAGPEISVASTKAFSTQLTALFLLSVHFGKLLGKLSVNEAKSLLDAVVHVPAAVAEALKCAARMEEVAKRFQKSQDFLFLGRGNCYPIALEGALKLKEISYIHAEGYPAGEMKHGPIALIDEKMPVVVVLQRSDLMFQKTLSNLREVQARGGKIIAITDIKDNKELKSLADELIELPFVSEHLSPIVLTIPLQLLSYYVAVLNGTDVDLPRNLAKSVTVE